MKRGRKKGAPPRSQLRVGLDILKETGESFISLQSNRQVISYAVRLGLHVSTSKMLLVDPTSGQSQFVTMVLPYQNRRHRGRSLECSKPLSPRVKIMRACSDMKLPDSIERALLEALDE